MNYSHSGWIPHVLVLLLDGVVGAGDHERFLVSAVAASVEPRYLGGTAPVAQDHFD